MDGKFRFIDSNGSVGFDGISYEFSSLSELIGHLDKLGIEAAVTWSKHSIPNVTEGNGRFLRELENTPGAKGRIFPSLTIAPTLVYEKNGVENLIESMQKYSIRSLRALPSSLYHDIFHLEFILEKLRRLKPVLFISAKETTDCKGITELAAKFPEIFFVFTDAMWGQMIKTMDMMKRQNNILVEISWIHTQDTIKLMADTFKASRILFGTGFRSHNAASIAGLVHAEISEKEKKLIACENIEKLLKLETEKIPPSKTAKKENPLWEAFLEGKKLDVQVIDAHTHISASSRWVNMVCDKETIIERMVRNMDRIGIEKSVTFFGSSLPGGPLEGNRVLAKMLKPYEDRFSACISFHPVFSKELSEKLDDFFADKIFAGFKILCDYWKVPITDERFIPAWEYADKHRLIIMIHTWTGIYDSPAMLKDIAPKYPNASFLLGHSGGTDPGRIEAEKLAQDNSNVYLEWCGSFCSSAIWEETIKKVGNDKVIFGSDTYPHSIHWELGRFLSLDIPWQNMVPMLGANIKKLLDMREF